MVYEGVVSIVEDDEFLGMRLELLLESYNLEVRTFYNGASFLEQFSPETQGCLVLDMMLPDMDGFQLLNQLKAKGSSVPVILMSAHASTEMIMDAVAAEVFRFLPKPLDDAMLVNSIVSAVEVNRKSQFSRKLDNLVSRIKLLTEEEKKVMERVAVGETDQDISLFMEINPAEVREVRHKIMDKMKARSTVDLGQVMLHLNRSQTRQPSYC